MLSLEPDKDLNPRKKMWEQIQYSAFDDDDRNVATDRGGPLNVKRKGCARLKPWQQN